ncbi:MAG: endonuclease/exonuclease/phosphatase family protein [Bacteroidales bacterium]
MKVKIILQVFVVVMFLWPLSGCSDSPGHNDIISFNIRYDNSADGINAWPFRREMVVSFLKDEAPALIGLQEVLWHQFEYIDSALTGYVSLAAGRNDGQRSGEMVPLFYREDLFRRGSSGSGTFWLSPTPDIAGSIGWGAVLPRIVTWSSLTMKSTGEEIFFFNTHFSHMSDSARQMSAGVLMNEVAGIAGEARFIITGDFNMVPGSFPWNVIVEGGAEDSFNVSAEKPAGNGSTFNGFSEPAAEMSASGGFSEPAAIESGFSSQREPAAETSTSGGSGEQAGEGRRIDYVFVSPGMEVLRHRTERVKQDSVYISDHWPVIVTLKLL